MPVDATTPVFPGSQKPRFEKVATIKKDGWNEKRLSFNSHFSTHIDAPFHMLEHGKKLDDFPISRFIGRAIVLHAKGKTIDLDLSAAKGFDFVFFLTGHTKKAAAKDFFTTNPVLSLATAKKLIAMNVKIIGIDSYTPDNYPYTIHKLLFRNDIMIVENLINLEKLAGKSFTCYVMPLNLQNSDGAPCRVVAILEK